MGKAEIGEDEATVTAEQVLCDPSVVLAGGVARGKCGTSPLFITHRNGKGKAILLNCTLPSLPELENPRTPLSMDKLMGDLFTQAGVVSQVRLVDAKGQHERNVQLVRWQNGDSVLLEVFRGARRAQRCENSTRQPRPRL